MNPDDLSLVTIPVYSHDVMKETMGILAPVAWHDRIKALSGYTVYGPNYIRGIVDNLADVNFFVRQGRLETAASYLERAERKVHG